MSKLANNTQIMLFVDSRLLLPIGAGSHLKPKIQLYYIIFYKKQTSAGKIFLPSTQAFRWIPCKLRADRYVSRRISLHLSCLPYPS